MSDELELNLVRVREKIRWAASKSGRTADDITLIAVSKTQPPELINAAIMAGQMVFGENRVQEARAKIPLCGSGAHWHHIGHLQKNKIRHALPVFEMLHGVDSVQLAQEVQRIAEEAGLMPQVLLQVNVAGEATKFGFKPSTMEAELEKVISEMPHLDVQGLMTIPPFAVSPEDSRPYFVTLRQLRDYLQDKMKVGLPHLSMGMSGDYEVAIEEGATMVRVGTNIFGNRQGKEWKPAGIALDD